MKNKKKQNWIECPEWIVALLSDIASELGRVKWNVTQKSFDDPFHNTGNSYSNDVFSVDAFDWVGEDQEYNFKYKDVKIRWYKYLGRGTEINGDYPTDQMIEMYNNCIRSLYDYEKNNKK